MYADRITDSMKRALEETDRRREIQEQYNTDHGISPQPLRKKIADITDQLAREDADTAELLGQFDYGKGKRGITGATSKANAAEEQLRRDGIVTAPSEDLLTLIAQLTEQMHAAASELQFELAARLRDEVGDLKKELRAMQAAGHA